jgi:hypothetical protein
MKIKFFNFLRFYLIQQNDKIMMNMVQHLKIIIGVLIQIIFEIHMIYFEHILVEIFIFFMNHQLVQKK